MLQVVSSSLLQAFLFGGQSKEAEKKFKDSERSKIFMKPQRFIVIYH